MSDFESLSQPQPAIPAIREILHREHGATYELIERKIGSVEARAGLAIMLATEEVVGHEASVLPQDFSVDDHAEDWQPHAHDVYFANSMQPENEKVSRIDELITRSIRRRLGTIAVSSTAGITAVAVSPDTKGAIAGAGLALIGLPSLKKLLTGSLPMRNRFRAGYESQTGMHIVRARWKRDGGNDKFRF